MTSNETTAAQVCWVCKSTDTVLWKKRDLDRPLEPQDFQITDKRYGITLTLLRCNRCSFIFADDREVGALTALYEALSDPAYEEGAENRALQMRWLLKLGSDTHPGARSLLEIGSGSGLLIREAQKLGLEATGVEPSHALVEAAQRLNGIQLLQGIFPHPKLDGQTFDLIYVVDVIEHVSDPVGLLADCNRALAPGGVIVVVTPDISSIPARLLKHKWWHLRLAHVGYFNSHSMHQAALAAGLGIRGTSKALWFFPVHYLADRLAVYLPVRGINSILRKTWPFSALYNRVIPLNLGDSTVFVMHNQDKSA